MNNGNFQPALGKRDSNYPLAYNNMPNFQQGPGAAGSVQSVSEADKSFQQAYDKHMAGNIQSAKMHYERIVRKFPKHVDTRYMLGTLLAQTGALELALMHLKIAVNHMPSSPMIHTNLGNVYLKLGKNDHAVHCYQNALELNPQIPEALFNLGVIFHQQKKAEEAVSSLEKSLESKPNFPAAYIKLGKIYRELNRLDRATATFMKLLEYIPDSLEALFELGNIFASVQDYANATIFFERILEIDPANESARHAVAALTGETTSVAPLAHVELLFDDLSGSFDQHIEQLGYRAPEILKEMLIAVKPDAKFERAVDMGCGTGLSGIQFRPIATYLTGFDMSQKMVDFAYAKGVYDELEKNDVGHFLSTAKQQYDLFIAADVFVYIGDLSEVFGIVKARAKQQACFVFSTEEALEQDFVLRPTGRYAHSRSYIERLAAANGFVLAASRSIDLRMEGQQAIKGDLFVCTLQPIE